LNQYESHMTMITEQQIDKVFDKLDASEEWYDELLQQMQLEQPTILAYLVAEQFDVLTVEEKDFMLYLALVIWQSVREVRGDIAPISETKLGEAEEANWAIFEANKARSFRKQLDAFYEQSKQEDLIALVEDALVDDGDDLVTQEGREPMFVALKTLIDVLTE